MRIWGTPRRPSSDNSLLWGLQHVCGHSRVVAHCDHRRVVSTDLDGICDQNVHGGGWIAVDR